MRCVRHRPIRVAHHAAALVAALGLVTGLDTVRSLRWVDLPTSVQRRLIAAGVPASSFEAFRREHGRRTQDRVRESDLDALVYYALQSTAFTKETPIEPGLSAKAFVDSLDGDVRQRFLSGQASPTDRVSAPTRRRLTALGAALRTAPPRSRLAYFRDIIRRETSPEASVETVLLSQYVRAMRFLYEKEFVAARRADSAAAVAALYRDRALSTDTAVESGYLVHLGLATLRALEPTRRIRRVLIVGPGLDLAPRTGLLDVGEPESYQPYAVADSLVALGLARLDDLAVLGADVNQRVVDRLQAARDRDASLTLVTGLGDSETVTLEDEYRLYFTALGNATAEALPEPTLQARYGGHLRKSLRIRHATSRVIEGVRLDIATERIDGDPFDLIIATNVFPYLDDIELTLTLANIAAMLTPGGALLHNEARSLVGEVTGELDLRLTHSRTAVIANVRGSATPLYDSVFIHVNQRSAKPR